MSEFEIDRIGISVVEPTNDRRRAELSRVKRLSQFRRVAEDLDDFCSDSQKSVKSSTIKDKVQLSKRLRVNYMRSRIVAKSRILRQRINVEIGEA